MKGEKTKRRTEEQKNRRTEEQKKRRKEEQKNIIYSITCVTCVGCGRWSVYGAGVSCTLRERGRET